MNNFLLENVFPFSQLKASVEDLILHVDNFHLPSRPFADPFCTFALLDTDLSLIRVVLSAMPPENWGKACILGKSWCACPANRKANNEWTQQLDFPQLENMGQVEPLYDNVGKTQYVLRGLWIKRLFFHLSEKHYNWGKQGGSHLAIIQMQRSPAIK